MKQAVVLAMHGSPPRDFPREDLRDLHRLHGVVEGGGPPSEADRRRHEEIEKKLLEWERTPENDPYGAASHDIAARMETLLGVPVVAAFNEFCGPDLGTAFRTLAESGTDAIVVVTPMMTPGGAHSERDIPAAIERARAAFPAVRFEYRWPFDRDAIAAFLADQVRRGDAGV